MEKTTLGRMDGALPLVILVALLVGVVACGSTDGDGDDTEVKIPDTTKVLGDSELAALESTGGDLSRLVFSSATGGLASLTRGEVVVAGVSGDKLPYGMLRRVTALDTSGGKLTLTTEQATLAEAIERGSINETVTLRPSSVASTTSALISGVRACDRITHPSGRRSIPSGVVAHRSFTGSKHRSSRLASRAPRHPDDRVILSQALSSQHYAIEEEDEGFVFAINDLELYDADGDASTKGDRVWADGNFSFKPVLKLDVEIDGFEIKTFTFEIGADQTATIQITAGREATFEETRTLESIELTPITFSIGPVPVVLVPRITFLAGIDGVVTAELTAGVSQDLSVRVGFGYQNGSWDPIAEFDPNAQFDAPQFRDGAKGTARLWAGPRASLALYDIAGVYGQVRGFIRGELDSTADPWWTLSAGIEAAAGVFLEVLDVTIADYETDPLEESVSLSDAGGPAPSSDEKVVTWARTFGGDVRDNIDNPLAVLSTSEGGSLLVGGTNSFNASPTDLWLLKLDRLGQISWQRAYEGARAGLAAVPTADGGYLVLAGEVSTGANDTRLIKVDANGDVVFSRKLTADKNLAGYTLVARGDDFVIGGVYGAGAGADFWLAAVDGAGKVKWSTALGGERNDEVHGLTVTLDGALVATGPTHSFGVTNTGHWLVKLDGAGKPIWQVVFDSDGSGNEWATDVVVDSEGDYRVIGRLGGDALVTRVSPDGSLETAFAYNTGPFDETYAGIPMADGGLLLAGKVGLGPEADVWLLRLTAQDEVQWTTAYGGDDNEEAGGTIQHAWTSTPLAATDDGGYLVLAGSKSFGGKFADFWLNKVSSTGVVNYDAESGAKRTSLTGTFREYSLTSSSTSVTAVDVPLTSAPIELSPHTPALRAEVQAAP